MTSVAVLVLGKSGEELSRFRARNPHIEANDTRFVYVANPGKIHGGMGQIGNRFIDEATEDIVSLIHADTTFGPGAIEKFAEAAAKGAVVGMVGCTRKEVLWSRGPGGKVITLDCCSVFMPRRVDLRFDDVTFDDFHCCVEDLCMTARQLGLEIEVPGEIEAHHSGGMVYDHQLSLGWLQNHGAYRKALTEKWLGHEVFTTCDRL